MQQSLLYFLSVVVGAILSYLINQLPTIPDIAIASEVRTQQEQERSL